MGTLLAIYIVGGLVLIFLSLPLIWNKVKPNSLYGFRVPQTLDNPELWYEVNHYAGKRLLGTGIIFVIAAAGLYFLPGISVDGYALACLAVFTLSFFVAIWQSWRYMKSLGKRR
jgi:hypothetical protein